MNTLKKGILAMSVAAMAMMGSCSQGEKTQEDANVNSTEAVIDNIMTRVSVRQFTDREISKDTLEQIVKAGMAAPSAMNKQPWAFVVLNERSELDSLKSVHNHANLDTATAAIVVCGDMEKAIEGDGRDFWIQDCSAVSENILLAAHAYGLGAVWCGVYPNPEVVPAVAKVLGLPENIIPLSIITMGYPANEPQPKDKWDETKVHYNRW